MTKEEKENWIINKFIKTYNREFNNDYKWERIPQNKYPGPDFIILNPKQEKKGVEVTELLEYPSEKTGQQKYLEKQFLKLLESKIDKNKFKNYYFCFYYFNYPSNMQQLEAHVDKIIEEIDRALGKDWDSERFEVIVDSQIIHVRKKNSDGIKPFFISFMFGEEGVNDSDRKNFFKGLKARIDEKNIASKKYNKEQTNILAIYDNTKYSICLNDIKKEISDELGIINSNEFEEIWLLSGGRSDKIFRIDN